MDKTQLDYAKAKALFQTIKAKADAEKKLIHEAETRKDITGEEWAEQTTAIEYKLGYWDAFDALVAAEKTLVNWAKTLLQTKKPSDYARVKEAFEKPIYSEELRQKLIDLCFRLDASTVR